MAAGACGGSVGVLRRPRLGPVVNKSAADPELDRSEHNHDDEQEVRDGRGVSEVEVTLATERLQVQVINKNVGRVERTATSGLIDLVKKLQRVDRQVHHQQQRRGTQQRQGHAAE